MKKLNQKKKFDMDKFIVKIGDYINGNGHWFLVGNKNLIQLSKNKTNDNFMIRVNVTDYNQAIINFLNDQEIEFTNWRELTIDELKEILNNNIASLNNYVNDTKYFS